MIEYKFDLKISAHDFLDICLRSGLNRPNSIDRLERMLNGSSLLCTAWSNNRLVGIARCLTDFSYTCYLSDLAVDKDYQKLGIGRELINLVRQQIGDECVLLLLSAKDAMTYYPHIGFEYVDNAWKIPRKI